MDGIAQRAVFAESVPAVRPVVRLRRLAQHAMGPDANWRPEWRGRFMETEPVPIAELRQYVAEMAQQLADLCRETMPIVAKMLEAASELAKAARP